jgi:hypothetical protein
MSPNRIFTAIPSHLHEYAYRNLHRQEARLCFGPLPPTIELLRIRFCDRKPLYYPPYGPFFLQPTVGPEPATLAFSPIHPFIPFHPTPPRRGGRGAVRGRPRGVHPRGH